VDTEKDGDLFREVKISEEIGMHNFYMNLSIVYYISFLANACESGKYAREAFLNFIDYSNENNLDPEIRAEKENVKPKFFSFLVRLNFDMFFF
jgi:hypothetical protein